MNKKGIVLVLVVALFAFVAQDISAAVDKIYWTDSNLTQVATCKSMGYPL